MGKHTLTFEAAASESGPLSVRNAEIVELSMSPVKRLRQIGQLARMAYVRRVGSIPLMSRRGLVELAEHSQQVDAMLEPLMDPPFEDNSVGTESTESAEPRANVE